MNNIIENSNLSKTVEGSISEKVSNNELLPKTSKAEGTGNSSITVAITQSVENEEEEASFSKARKHLIVFIVAFACFLSPISTTMFLPAVPKIAKQFSTTGTIINVSNACYCVVMAVSPCLASPIADLYGTKIIFISCSLGYAISSFIVSQSQNLAMFFVFRSLMAIFGTAFFSVGSTVIANIYSPKERGGPMGFILVGSQTGVSVAAVLGGIIVEYSTWSIIFIVLGGIGMMVFVLSIFFLPETSSNLRYYELREATGKKLIWIKFNPLKILTATKYENLLLSALASSSLMYNMYTLLTPIRYVVDPLFGIESSIKSSLFYLGPGVGYTVGSFIGGKWADYYVRKYIKKHGRRIPEDRLRSTYIWLGLMIPFSCLLYGWSLERGVGGIPLPIIAMLINGFSQTMSFPSINAYCVDSMPQLKGIAIANNYCLRFLASAIASGTILPQVNNMGIGWTSTITALVVWMGFACTLILIKYGEKLRYKHFPKLDTRSTDSKLAA